MKIGIMTFHWATNYGAVLQSYALSRALSSLGNDVEIVDYYPSRYKKNVLRALMTLRPKVAKGIIKQIPKERLIENFRKNNLNRSKYYKSNRSLLRENFDYDCYICGSDQVWNESFLERGEYKKTYSYFLNFAPNDKIIASYAASFGVTKYKEGLKEDLIKCLNRFDYISVREKTGLEILSDIGFREAYIVPDPTLLLKKEDYEKFIKKEDDSSYAFLYMLHNRDNDAEKAIELAEQHDYKICECGDIGIEEWLNKIYHSKMVITNSFHGIVFSIIFEKPFIALLIEGSGMNDRILTLLKELGLENRIFGKENFCDKSIDWENVEKKLESYRGIGYDYLYKVLGLKNGIDC